MPSLVFGDPEVRRLARQLDKLTGNGCQNALPKRPANFKTAGGPSSSDFTAKPKINAEVRATDSPFGVIVTQLQDMERPVSPRLQTPAATSCGERPRETELWMDSRHDSKSSDIVSNLLQYMSKDNRPVSPRSPAAIVHRNGAASSTGTLWPFSTGWGALHPSAEVKQRPAVLRSRAQAGKSEDVAGISKELSGYFGDSFDRKNHYQVVLPRTVIEATASERRNFPEIKLLTSIPVPPVPLELFRPRGPILNPKYRSSVRIDTEWHTQQGQRTTSTGPFPDDGHLPISPGAANESLAPNVHHESVKHDSLMFDDCVEQEQQARASPTQFATDGMANKSAHDSADPLARSECAGDPEREQPIAFADSFGQDADYVESYGSHSLLPPVRNASSPSLSTSSPNELYHNKGSKQATIKLAKVVIGVPMSKSGHNIALNRWIRSQAVVAEQFQRSKQLLAGPADLPPPLERVSPSTFRKTLTKAPPSRVLSPDSKPTGNVGISIRISPARYSRSPSPDKSSTTKLRSQKQKPRTKSAEKRVDEVDVVQVDSAASSTSTPSPPPPPVMRLGGIVRGEKNVFVGEKSEQSVGVDHFGRSNIFSK